MKKKGEYNPEETGFFLLAFYAVFSEIKDGITERNMKGLAKGLLALQ